MLRSLGPIFLQSTHLVKEIRSYSCWCPHKRTCSALLAHFPSTPLNSRWTFWGHLASSGWKKLCCCGPSHSASCRLHLRRKSLFRTSSCHRWSVLSGRGWSLKSLKYLAWWLQSPVRPEMGVYQPCIVSRSGMMWLTGVETLALLYVLMLIW